MWSTWKRVLRFWMFVFSLSTCEIKFEIDDQRWNLISSTMNGLMESVFSKVSGMIMWCWSSSWGSVPRLDIEDVEVSGVVRGAPGEGWLFIGLLISIRKHLWSFIFPSGWLPLTSVIHFFKSSHLYSILPMLAHPPTSHSIKSLIVALTLVFTWMVFVPKIY